jgi:allantoicase
MPRVRTVLAAAFIGLCLPACAEQMQVPGSPIVLDLPSGFTAAHGGLESARLRALVRVFTDQDFASWEQFLRISARAYKQGKLSRSDQHLYYFYLWPNTRLAEFNFVFNQAGVTANVRFEVDTESITKNSITVDDIERILASARVVPLAAPAKP